MWHHGILLVTGVCNPNQWYATSRDSNSGSNVCIPSCCQTYGGYHWFNLNSIYSKDLGSASTASDG